MYIRGAFESISKQFQWLTMKQTINTKASKQCTMMPYEEGGKRKGGEGKGGEGREGREGRREIGLNY